jgi:glycosyltransferase involved in cell wall biosynthesis
MDIETDEYFAGNSSSNLHTLFIAYYFPPMGLSGVQRSVKFAKYLPENGWDVSVLTTTPEAYYAFDETLLDELKKPNIKIFRTPPDATRLAKKKDSNIIEYPSLFSQKLKRIALQAFLQPDSRIIWRKPALKLASQILENANFHTIFATAPPFTDFLIAKTLSEKYDLPYVIDYRDLWVDNAYYYYITPFHKLKAINMETDVLMRSKRIIVINRFMKEKLLQRYKFLSHQDITIIPHGYDEEDFSPFRHLKPNENKFTITHSGLFPDDLTPKYFLKALSLYLKKNPKAKGKIRAVFVGLIRKSHQKYIRKYNLGENVELKGYLPHKECIKEIMQSDVLWMMSPNNIVTPSRFYEYIGARKPMLVCVPEGNIRQLALETDAAIATEPKDIKQILEAIDLFYTQWETGTLPKANVENSLNYERRYLTTLLARELAFSANY